MPKLFNEPIMRTFPSGPRGGGALAGVLLALALSQGAMAGPAKKPADVRPDYTAAQAATAQPEGLPASVRIAGDDTRAFQALIDGAPRAADPWLVLSGVGPSGVRSSVMP